MPLTQHNFEQARRELFSEGSCSALSEFGLSDARHQGGFETREVDMLDTVQFVEEKPTSYATASDLCEAFIDGMSSLYLLAFLLTGNDGKAERCFISALDECVEDTGVVRAWATALTRRAIIERSIQMIRPVPESTDNFSLTTHVAQNSPFAAIRALGTFERFVFIMSILEGWSEQDCALRLRCSWRDVTIARLLALKSVGSTDAAYTASNGSDDNGLMENEM
jgi:hypothetical protein